MMDNLEKVRKRVLNRFVDDVFEYCEKYNFTFMDELLFLLNFMIKLTIETIKECGEDD